MKCVLNKCYGGFGLTNEAWLEYFKRKGIEAKLNPYDYNPNEFYASYKDPYDHWRLVITLEDEENFRLDETLVDLVSEMGSECWGDFAMLEIVEVDSKDFHIVDSDGFESIRYFGD